MPVLYTLAAIIGVLLLLLHSRVYVTFAYRTDDRSSLSMDLSYLFLKLRLMPKKEKRVRIKDYSYKNLQKKKRKEAKTAEKAKAKEARKNSPKKKASDGTGSPKKTEAEPKKKDKSVVSALFEIRDLIFDALKRFPGKFRLDVNRLIISVGGKDAATTAITYGIVTEAVGALLTLLESGIKMRRGGANDIMITPDYISGRIDADVKIRLSIKPASVLDIAFRFLIGYVSKMIKK